MSSTISLSLFAAPSASDHSANLFAAARALAVQLARSRPLDRRLVAGVMTTAFGASDAEGVWSWRDAYDAIEAATVLQIRRLAPQVARLEDAPTEIATVLAAVSALGLTHTRRSEEQVALDQFSTPPQLAALVALAARVQPGDRVLEPSAGTGLLAVVAEACGGVMTLNEVAGRRADLLDCLFRSAVRTRHDGRHIHDLAEGAGAFDVVIANPPFTNLADHLVGGLKALADHGRLAAIVPLVALTEEALLRRLGRDGAVIGRIALPSRGFVKHGTSIETGLLIVDRTDAAGGLPPVIEGEDPAAAIAATSHHQLASNRLDPGLARASRHQAACSHRGRRPGLPQSARPQARRARPPAGSVGRRGAPVLCSKAVARRRPRRRPVSGP